MLYRIVMCIVASLVLSSCISNKISRRNLDAIQNGERAAIILSCRFKPNLKSPFAATETGCRTKWKNKDTKKMFNQWPMKKIYVVNPGIYSLKWVHAEIDDLLIKHEYSAKNLQHMAEFRIDGGEVLYLGNLMFDLAKSNSVRTSISINDKYDEAISIMQKENPILSDKLQKRLIRK